MYLYTVFRWLWLDAVLIFSRYFVIIHMYEYGVKSYISICGQVVHEAYSFKGMCVTCLMLIMGCAISYPLLSTTGVLQWCSCVWDYLNRITITELNYGLIETEKLFVNVLWCSKITRYTWNFLMHLYIRIKRPAVLVLVPLDHFINLDGQ